jgi:hypothetical protein
MTSWPRRYKQWKVGEPLPGIRPHHGFIVEAPEPVVEMIKAGAQAPFVGITTDGIPRAGVWKTTPTGRSPEPIVAAAREFLDSVDQPDYRSYIQQPLDSWHRRNWFNAMPVIMPAGVLLEDLRAHQREKALKMVRACFSGQGYELLRKAMMLNEATGDIVNMYTDSWHEFCVFVTIFGEPSMDEPWAWQLQGTHIDVNCTVAGDQMSLEPLFLGAEICEIEHGPFTGLAAFQEEEAVGLALGAALTDAQREKAVLYPSMKKADLPPELAGPVDGRHIGGAGRDNLVRPHEGICVTEFSAQQRALLAALFDVYLDRLPEGYRQQRRKQILDHLDETYVAYIGAPSQKPFYYRIHSPSVWIEFDHHPGLMLADAEDPMPFHIHTIMRMPNGGDYGMAWIQQKR